MSTIATEKKPTEQRNEMRLALENVRGQVLTFSNQIQEYLTNIQAEVENYKFSVEKHGDGVEVEIDFKAFVHPKLSEASKIIPK